MNSKWRKRLGAWAFLIVFVFSVNSVSASHGGRAVPQMMERLLPISLRWEPFFDIRVFADDADDVMQQAEQAINGCDRASFLEGRRVIGLQV